MSDIAEKIAAVESAAKDTTPGPWEYRLEGDEREGVYCHGDIVFGGSFCDYMVPSRSEYKYIALANPATILELIEYIRVLEAEVTRREALDHESKRAIDKHNQQLAAENAALREANAAHHDQITRAEGLLEKLEFARRASMNEHYMESRAHLLDAIAILAEQEKK